MLRTRDRGRTTVRTVLTGTLALSLLAACSWGTPSASDGTTAASSPSATPEPDPVGPTPVADPEPTVVVEGDGAAAARATVAALLDAAPVVVLAAADETAGVLTAASAAVATGAPVLLTDGTADDAPDLAAELERLGTSHVLVVGAADAVTLPAGVESVAVAAGADADALRAVTGHRYGGTTPVDAGGEAAAVAALTGPTPDVLVPAGASADGDAPDATGTASPTTGTATPSATGRSTTSAATPAPADASAAALPPTAPAEVTGVLGLRTGTVPLAAAATLRALGVPTVAVPGGDPRATPDAVQAVADADPRAVVAFGDAFGDAATLARRVATARTGAELPGGGQLVFPSVEGHPGKRYVALYGTPGSAALGVLGEQDVPATVARAEQHAAPFRDLTTDTVVPAAEIIATIASSGPEADGSYSRKRPVEDLRPLVEAAGAAGQYVVLDLQPGRQDFVTQAQLYADLLALPHVGLALDPEWRLAPDQVHLRQIGTVGIDEVNATADWLAQFTRERDLPQKMFVLHQFSLRMIGDRERLDTSHDELAPVIHVDGQGSQPAKAGTWATLRNGAPPVHWGWKNFYDEDTPMLDPAQTYQVQPVPDLVTYQ